MWPAQRHGTFLAFTPAACLASFLLSGPASAAVFAGDVPTQSYFSQFIGKFCYDFDRTGSNVGEMSLVLSRVEAAKGKYPSSGKLFFMLFDDEGRHWKKVQDSWKTSTCEEKQSNASDTMELSLPEDKQEMTFTISVKQQIRPRFWYFLLTACGVELPEPLKYKLHTQNAHWGWQQEFSFDHVGLYYKVLSVFAASALLGGLTLWASCSRIEASPVRLIEHPYLKLLLLSYATSTVSCIFFLIHYTVYSHDGHGLHRLRFLGVVMSAISNFSIFLIAILSSTGWGIINFYLLYRRAFIGMLAAVGIFSLFIELKSAPEIDESTKLSHYQSGPGVLSLVLKIFIFCWFACQLKATLDVVSSGKNRRFFTFLGIGITIWALNLPVVTVLAMRISPWYRYKVVTTAELIARCIGQAMLSQLLCGPLSPLSLENTFLPPEHLAEGGGGWKDFDKGSLSISG